MNAWDRALDVIDRQQRQIESLQAEVEQLRTDLRMAQMYKCMPAERPAPSPDVPNPISWPDWYVSAPTTGLRRGEMRIYQWPRSPYAYPVGPVVYAGGKQSWNTSGTPVS